MKDVMESEGETEIISALLLLNQFIIFQPWPKVEKCHSHVGYEVLKSHSPHPPFIAHMPILITIKSCRGMLTYTRKTHFESTSCFYYPLKKCENKARLTLITVKFKMVVTE